MATVTAQRLSDDVGAGMEGVDCDRPRLAGAWLAYNAALLREQAGPRRTIAGYYQGLSSVRKDGMYPSTRRYVASVLAIRARLRHGWDPA